MTFYKLVEFLNSSFIIHHFHKTIYSGLLKMKTLTQPAKLFFLFFISFLIIFSEDVSAEMSSLTNSQLSEVTGTGIIVFDLDLADNLARIDAGFDMGTYMEIDSMKLGHYDDGGGTGWDQDWTGVTFGTGTDELKIKGIYFEASYANVSDSAARELTSIKIGSSNVTGSITALLNSFSGSIENTSGEIIMNGHRLGERLTNPVSAGVTLNNSEAYIQLDAGGGYSIHFTNAQMSIN